MCPINTGAKKVFIGYPSTIPGVNHPSSDPVPIMDPENLAVPENVPENCFKRMITGMKWLACYGIAGIMGWVTYLIGMLGMIFVVLASTTLMFLYYPSALITFGLYYLYEPNCPGYQIPVVILVGGVISAFYSLYSLTEGLYEVRIQRAEMSNPTVKKVLEVVAETLTGPTLSRLQKRAVKIIFWAYWIPAAFVLLYSFYINRNYNNELFDSKISLSIDKMEYYCPMVIEADPLPSFFIVVPLGFGILISFVFVVTIGLLYVSAALKNKFANLFLKEKDLVFALMMSVNLVDEGQIN